jgi:hypothetical protein
VWKFILRRLIEAAVAVSVIISVVLVAASIHPSRPNTGNLPYGRLGGPMPYVKQTTMDIRRGLFVRFDRNDYQGFCSGC